MPLDGVKNIVLVLSGKGGVGKSSVTLQLALALSLQGKSVGILDIDLTGPSIPRFVGLEDAKIRQVPGGWLPVVVHDAADGAGLQPQPQPQQQQKQQQQVSGRGSLRCMSLGFLLRDRGDAVIWRGPKKTAMIRQFLTDVLWGETDFLLIDTPPGTGDEHIALAEQLLTVATPAVPTSGGGSSSSSSSSSALPRLAGAVLVTTPQAVATSDVRKEINFCIKTGIPILGVIENMAGYACPCCGEVTNLFSSGGGEAMARQTGVRFLGSVPVDVKFGALIEGGDSDGDGDGDGGAEMSASVHEVDDRRPLVEKYRDDCSWSFERFSRFATTLISGVDG